MNDNNPYEYADEQIELLRQEINAEFQNQINLTSIDELNVIRAKADVKSLYSKLLLYHTLICERVSEDAYKSALALAVSMGYEEPQKRPKKHSATAMVASLFLLYSAVTKYQYSGEASRKRDRLMEGILSAPNRQALRDAYYTGAKAWFNQAKQYTDMSVDVSRDAAFRDAGVEYVQWVTERDNRVCHICRERDGMIYKIDNVPDKPHIRCRCHLIPVSRPE